MPFKTTLRRRIMLATTGLCLGILLVAGAGVYLGVRGALRASLDDALRSIAAAEIASAADEPGGRIHVHSNDTTSLSLTSQSGYEKFAQIENSRDRVIARTPNLQRGPKLSRDAKAEKRARGGQITFADIHLGDEPLRCVYYPFRAPDGEHLLAIVSIPQRPMQKALQSLLGALGLSLLLGGVAASLGAGALARRLTRPLEQMAQAAREIGEDNLDARLTVAAPDAEIADVTRVLNEMLGRLEAAFVAQQALISSQRRFVADASHELRSPLSNLRGTVEVALRRPRTPEDYRETLQVSLAEIERLSRLVTALLTLSRADAGGLARPFEACDLCEIAARSVAAHKARAAQNAVELRLDCSENLRVVGDADRLREVADNLLDNALRYAPASSHVAVTVGRDGDNCVLSVEDCGPGLNEADLERVFDRFYRADSSRARQSGGLGLGLAIVKAIAQSHGGEVCARNRDAGGAMFVVRLPVVL